MSLPDPRALAQAASAATDAAAQLPAQAAQAWAQATSTQAAQAAQAKGLAAATGLLQNGYDSSRASDNQALVATIAGGAACIPAVGPVLAGAIGLLDAGGEALGSALQAVGIIPKPGCKHSGNVTPDDVLAAMVAQGAKMPRDSFAALAFPAIAYNVAQQLTCAPSYPTPWVLQAIVSFWNTYASGDLAPVADAPLADWGYAPGSSTPFASTGQAGAFAVQGSNPSLADVFQPIAGATPVQTQGGIIGGIAPAGSIFVRNGTFRPQLHAAGPSNHLGNRVAGARGQILSTGSNVRTVLVLGGLALAGGAAIYALTR